MRRLIFLPLGLLSLALAAAGTLLPLLPTVPFVLLAAFCFAKSSPRMETWLLEHRTLGPHVHAWRAHRAISRDGKRAAWAAFALSATIGVLFLPGWWRLAPVLCAIAGSCWIASLPTAPRSALGDED